MKISAAISVGIIGVFGLLAGCGVQPSAASEATAPLTAEQAIAAAEHVHADSAKFGAEKATLASGSWDVDFVASEGEVHSVVDARSGEVVSTELVTGSCMGSKPYCGPGRTARCCGDDGGWSCYACY
jgi:hypothetical protein